MRTEVAEDQLRSILNVGPKRNMMVPWYLILSYLYYAHDVSLVPDSMYDDLCAKLERWFDHMHKDLIERDALRAGTGFYLVNKLPHRVMFASISLAADCGIALQVPHDTIHPPKEGTKHGKKRRSKTRNPEA